MEMKMKKLATATSSPLGTLHKRPRGKGRGKVARENQNEISHIQHFGKMKTEKWRYRKKEFSSQIGNLKTEHTTDGTYGTAQEKL
jgi:hypothetical protein